MLQLSSGQNNEETDWFEDAASEANTVADVGDVPSEMRLLGKVCAPLQREATSQEFYFWFPEDVLVERGEIVTTAAKLSGEVIRHFGIVDEVYRTSRAKSVAEEQDQHDGDPQNEPPFQSNGYNFAKVMVLSVDPERQTAPRERAQVERATEEQITAAYRMDDVPVSDRLTVGLVKNGGEQVAGMGFIDLRYLLGRFGAHLLVTGAAGRGAKSSFLLHLVKMLVEDSRTKAQSSTQNVLRIVPIVFNVKNFDLFFLDRDNTGYDPIVHGAEWARLGMTAPTPFSDATFYAPQNETAGATTPITTGRDSNDVQYYSWSLSDIIAGELFPFLFADADSAQVNFSTLAQDIENLLTLRNNAGNPILNPALQVRTFQQLAGWVDTQASLNDSERQLRNHATGTWRMFYRRLLRLIYDSSGVLRRDDLTGQPLDVVRDQTCDPIVVDLFSLSTQPELQRFVVATTLQQLKANRRIGNPSYVAEVRYLVVLDELNRFAPRGAKDAVTRLFEEIAGQLRSSGIVLLGAQQAASRVAEPIVINAGVTALGATSPVELADPVWRSLSKSAERKAANLRNTEKLLIQQSCPEPIHLRIPFPAWAMNAEEAVPAPIPAEEQEEIEELLD